MPSGADKTVATILGEIVWLMSQSAEFKQCLISDLEWLVMPAILLRQFRIYYQGEQPIGVALYARTSPPVAAKIDTGTFPITAEEWSSGRIIKIVKVISPFGGGDQFASDILKRISE